MLLQSVNVRLEALVNDSTSALLARAYLDPATRLAYILGTGINAGVHLPIDSLHPSKFARRSLPKDPYPTHVLTNTEFSMFGKNILPVTHWDQILNENHIIPDYQPFEYMVAGGYMGEIVRLIIMEAIKSAQLFGGHIPPSLAAPYALETKTLAFIEADSSDTLSSTRSLLQKLYPSDVPHTFVDAIFIKKIIRSVTTRSITYFATGVHAVSSLLQDLERQACLEDDLDHISIGCDGSVINRYPNYMERAQGILDDLRHNEGRGKKRIILEKTSETAVLGAGIAAAMAAAAAAAAPGTINHA